MTLPPPRPSLGRRLAIAGVASATAVVLALSGATTASAASKHEFPGAKPSWAKSSADAGSVAADTTVEGEVYFDLKDQAGAERLARAVSTPGSSSYGRYVSPSAWIKKYSPSKSDYTDALRYLKRSGFTITGQPTSRLFIVFRGSAAAIDSAFGASLRRFHYRGHTLVAPSAVPSITDPVGTKVSGLVLDQQRTLTRPGLKSVVKPSGADTKGKTARSATTPAIETPCSDFYDENSAALPQAYGTTSFPTYICGYNGKQLRQAYQVPSGSNGQGQTVAIIDAYASPTIVKDVNRLSLSRQQRPLTTYSQRVPKTFYDEELCEGPSGWQGEQTLDVQAVHNIAPSSRILYVGGFNCAGGLDTALSDVLDNRRANIVTNSYGDLGEPPLYAIQGEENQHLQAVAEGIGLYYSSGDSGDETVNGLTPQPDYLASSPWVTSVGGTTLGIAKDGSVALETGWGTAVDPVVAGADGSLGYAEPLPGEYVFGAGGGRSTLFDQPWYQSGVVPAGLAGGKRVSPDVAADADPYTGEVIGISPIVDDETLQTGAYEEETYGGTSLASPLFAAQVALVQQAIGKRLGFLNPVLYKAYTKDRAAFRDVLPVTSAFAYTSARSGTTYLVTNDVDSSLTTTTGYDDVTGLGSLTLGQLNRISRIARR